MNKDNELRLTRVEDYMVGRSTETNIIPLDNDGHCPTAARQPPDIRQTAARQPPDSSQRIVLNALMINER